ncbi:MAG: hypothetical protein K2I23_07430 [Clostridia bacterium]|nr:hypothetical protein [Clostridia bacterium]
MNDNKEIEQPIDKKQFGKLDYKVSVEDLLMDFRILLKDYYHCTLTSNHGLALKLIFTNGQKFLLKITEL